MTSYAKIYKVRLTPYINGSVNFNKDSIIFSVALVQESDRTDQHMNELEKEFENVFENFIPDGVICDTEYMWRVDVQNKSPYSITKGLIRKGYTHIEGISNLIDYGPDQKIQGTHKIYWSQPDQSLKVRSLLWDTLDKEILHYTLSEKLQKEKDKSIGVPYQAQTTPWYA